MPPYSFKERFCPMILDGSKTQTVRNRRRYPAKKGSKLYLYYGLRTKNSKKLREEVCTHTTTIRICSFEGIRLYNRRLTNEELNGNQNDAKLNALLKYLSPAECNRFAWLDGFRPDGTTLENPNGSFDLMIRFWQQTHALPWWGDVIYWK